MMQCRDITTREFEEIASELVDMEYQAGAVETIRGRHDAHGRTLLLRDATRCVALVDDPTSIDRVTRERAFFDEAFPSVTIGRC